MENKKTNENEKERISENEQKEIEIIKEKNIIKKGYILLEKTKSLYTLLIPHLNRFPKDAKFVLRVQIEDCLINIIRKLISKNYSEDNPKRRNLILQVISEIHLLSILLQQAASFRYISYQNYEIIFNLTKEISAMSITQYKNLGGENENLQ